ncbi:IPTL-CTERM sorting domain-containing protein [Zoogloea sp.]|uniref:IPTL-CTERM sorting domain-containing protein n=1 Tax=Zoogloea sp. TaxID=49181 RepID=UPI0031FDACB0
MNNKMHVRLLIVFIAFLSIISGTRLAAADTCLTDSAQADFQNGLTATIDLTTSPGDIMLLKPDVIDQQNPTVGTSGVGVTTTTWAGQTFTPAMTGQLTKVDINLFCSGCTGTTPNLTLSLRATSGGLPTGADLATATVSGFASGASAFYTATFASPYTVTAGTQYAIVIRPTTNPAPGTYALTRSGTAAAGSNVYAGGTRVAGATSGTVWSVPLTGGVSTDAGFNIYINSGYVASGSLTSATKDSNPASGYSTTWTSLSWTGATPPNTTLRFQVAASNSNSGPFSFVGPDGTAATFFTTTGASLGQFNGNRYLQYKALLSSSDSTVTPVASDVTTCFTTLPPPAVTAVSPTAGPTTGGTVVTISGSGFTGATAVNFGALGASSFTVDSDTQVTATSPAGTAGAVDITVVTVGGTSTTSGADQFSYAAAPTVTAVSPGSGAVAGGGTVTVTGTNFVTGATTVSIGGAACTAPSVTSATSLTCTVPPGSAGTASVVATSAGGSSPANALYAYVALPTVTAVSPAGGPTAGGTTVTITGTGFGGASAVRFGASNAASFTVNSATTITASSPAANAGTVDITVVTIGGTSAVSASDRFAYAVRQTGEIPAAAGGGTIVARIASGSPGCSIDLANTTSFVPPSFNGTVPPLGGLKVKVIGCPAGEAVTLAVTFSNLNGVGAMKYGKTPTSNGASVWYTPDGMSIQGNTITYSVTDNGLGDDTFTGPDGVINDPIVPVAAPTKVAGIPALSGWGLVILSALLGLMFIAANRRTAP